MRRVIPIAIALIGILALASCGGSSTTTEVTTTAPHTTGRAIKECRTITFSSAPLGRATITAKRLDCRKALVLVHRAHGALTTCKEGSSCRVGSYSCTPESVSAGIRGVRCTDGRRQVNWLY